MVGPRAKENAITGPDEVMSLSGEEHSSDRSSFQYLPLDLSQQLGRGGNIVHEPMGDTLAGFEANLGEACFRTIATLSALN